MTIEETQPVPLLELLLAVGDISFHLPHQLPLSSSPPWTGASWRSVNPAFSSISKVNLCKLCHCACDVGWTWQTLPEQVRYILQGQSVRESWKTLIWNTNLPKRIFFSRKYLVSWNWSMVPHLQTWEWKWVGEQVAHKQLPRPSLRCCLVSEARDTKLFRCQ